VISLLSASGLYRPSEINASMAGVSADSRQSGRKPSIPIISTRASSVWQTTLTLIKQVKAVNRSLMVVILDSQFTSQLVAYEINYKPA
jgi:hypothetical protein